MKKTKLIIASICGAILANSAAFASSHGEAPLIKETPKVDATDFYMFRSYEPGRENYVTLIANYLPLQDAYGGPNYFTLDDNAIYEIHIDNNGDAIEDWTFQFDFENTFKDTKLTIGTGDNAREMSVPLINIGPISVSDDSALLLQQTYTLSMIEGPRRASEGTPLESIDGLSTFTKPVDNIGTKSIADYNAYANQFIYEIDLPGTDINGRLFVGQRKDPFVVNLGEIFDLINITDSPVGSNMFSRDDLEDKNVTSLILELPIAFLTSSSEVPVIAGWTTSSIKENDTYMQVSRLGHPLVNEVVIGLPDKDRFNASEPKDDAQFLAYVTNPVLPALIEILFDVPAPTAIPRQDLVQAFLTGVPGLTEDGGVGEILRLNTSIAVTPAADQMPLGVLQGDNAGFPNGRRPGDDIVDATLRVAMGVLLSEEDAPAGQAPFTDGAFIDARMFPAEFPYLNDPIPGSPQDLRPGQDFFSFLQEGSFEDDAVVYFDRKVGSYLFTQAEVFPSLYDFNGQRWIYYFMGTTNPRVFFDFTNQQIFVDQ
ncbi:DUF4331 domain-containing protein [Rubellicoccus peritrichatus]|uniref:DUF4331 domain-containing protein n=1 Tax=Rubellicoccus peritrichatus TaxID=3080537 RepID=A0AAQ3QTH7_9BACT|nr:DUF4331 domain-containing protein [Puniceicoccus sp. CR14]WOO39393.1 DUF4331 domain-containing protein [Puniceicoccus sp. CR14]